MNKPIAVDVGDCRENLLHHWDHLFLGEGARFLYLIEKVSSLTYVGDQDEFALPLIHLIELVDVGMIEEGGNGNFIDEFLCLIGLGIDG